MRPAALSLDMRIAQWSQGWRGPLLAALIALVAGLPGLFAMPPLDRDESRFAQATAQMLERDDFVVIRFQDQPRFKKPIGIHWLQAASVAALSDPDARQIWAYRLPSLLGAMLAAAACAWGARALFDPRVGLAAGAILGSTFLLSTEAFIAKTDAVLCGATTLAMAALARIYAEANGGPPAGRRTRLAFWIGLAIATLDKGPIGPMVVALTLITLMVWDRKAGWVRGLGWIWGPILLLAVIGPWAWAVTVATDGGFWSQAIAGDLAPKLAGGQETHGQPPGFHALLTPILFFPGTLLLPAGLVLGWKVRREPGVRFALAWLIPAWLVFEATPTKLVHYTLPCYGALAILAAAALRGPLGVRARWIGAGLAGAVGLLLAGGVAYLMKLYGDPSDLIPAIFAGGLLGVSGGVGGYFLLKGQAGRALAAGIALAIVGHGVLVAALAPGLKPLWLSQRTEEILARQRLLPRQGIVPPPIAVAGYAEPSLVFGAGTPTQLGDADDAANAISDGRAAVVEGRADAAFQQAVAGLHATPRKVGEVQGIDYSTGKKMVLNIYAPSPEAPEAAPADDATATTRETRP